MAKDPNAPVVVATALTDAEAGLIASTLRERGIEARVFDAVGSVLSIYGPALNQPIQIVVRRCEADRAAAALRDVREESIDIDWSQVDTGDPSTPGGPEFQLPKSRIPAPLLLAIGIVILAVPIMMWNWNDGDVYVDTSSLLTIALAAIVIGGPMIFMALLALLKSDK